MSVFEQILKSRGLADEASRQAFLNPDYGLGHNPFLLPDMSAAVDRLERALGHQQRIVIYGDYDIDGLTATAVLLDALASFGFERVRAFIPNRFKEGYGLTVEAVEQIAAEGADLIITVDCGSLSTAEIERSNQLGVDVIVTDHHNVQPIQPPAVAVINPKRLLMEKPDLYENYMLKLVQPTSASFSETASRPTAPEFASGSVGAADVSEKAIKQAAHASDAARLELGTELYPFLDLPGVGVAFKLVQALQTRLDGLPMGQEKWLLDLVALGTVCDVVTLQDENRTHVYWGLKVLAKTRRPGLKALMAVAGINPKKLTARDLGFGLGPRMNAAGRLETAQYALDMLTTQDSYQALEKSQQLDDMNKARRAEQDRIFQEAIQQAEQYVDNPVLVVSSAGWSHGIIGIVAAKLLEKYSKPTFVLEEMGAESKGSARSYGDFSAADAIRSADSIITKGGGHRLAAGVTLPTKNIDAFREQVNRFYQQQAFNQQEQQAGLLPEADAEARLADINEDLIDQIAQLEPFGNGNQQPVIKTSNLLVEHKRVVGSDSQHVKLTLKEGNATMDFIAFSAPKHYFVKSGSRVTVWYQPDINEWRGNRSVEGRIVRLEVTVEA